MLSGQIVAMVLATFVGLSLGALGGGGSIITLPLLVYVGSIPAEAAVGMSLVVVGVTSLFGALVHLSRGNVALRPSLLFAATGTAGSLIGSTGTHLLSARSLMLLFSSIMLLVGLAMWRTTAGLRPSESCLDSRCLYTGFFVGLLTGFLGIGGGFLIVPALVLFAGLDARMAAGTSLVIITVNSLTGLLGQLRFALLDWNFLAGFLLFAVGGMVIGTALAHRIAPQILRRIFATTILVMAVTVGLGNLLS